jgi:alanine dehydrogenase
MVVGVPKESFPGERRVALVHAVIPRRGYEMSGKKTIYRDSDTGRIISRPDADRRDPCSVEKERVPAR